MVQVNIQAELYHYGTGEYPSELYHYGTGRFALNSFFAIKKDLLNVKCLYNCKFLT